MNSIDKVLDCQLLVMLQHRQERREGGVRWEGEGGREGRVSREGRRNGQDHSGKTMME